MTLEETMQRLESYCRTVDLSYAPNLGWWCRGELRVTVTGGQFKMQGEANHPAPLPAAQELLERVEACLRDVHKLAAETPLNTARIESL